MTATICPECGHRCFKCVDEPPVPRASRMPEGVEPIPPYEWPEPDEEAIREKEGA